MRFFGKEQWQELIVTLSANKLRTALTGLAVGWGIMLLVILLSSGMGLLNGIMRNVNENGLNETGVRIDFGYVSKPYRGLSKYHKPQYTAKDCEQWLRTLPQWIVAVAPFSRKNGVSASYGEKQLSINITGITPNYQDIKYISLYPSGRYLNSADVVQNRKTIILNKAVADALLLGEQDLGTVIYIADISFTFVGICHDNSGLWGDNYIPLSTMQMLGLSGNSNRQSIQGAMLKIPNLRNESDEALFLNDLRRVVAIQKGFDPTDTSTIYASSQATTLGTLDSVFAGINIFLWLIGLSILLIGLVGVMNIMQIVVTERRREIGIRKALGAKRHDIIMMIILEAILVTLVSGLAGMVLGVALMAVADYIITLQGWGIQQIGNFNSYLYLNPTISPLTAIGAIGVMILGGVMAGYLPAKKALNIPTIEAMKQ